MKKFCLLLLCCLIAFSPLHAFSESITCYTGPGKNYATLAYELTAGTTVTMLTRAYDEDSHLWLQVEISEGENLLRVYLPEEHLSGDFSSLTIEQPWEALYPEMLAMPYLPTTPHLGPGAQYNILDVPLDNETQGVIILIENGWGLLDLHLEEPSTRMWIELSDLQY